MIRRDAALRVAKLAGEVLQNSHTRSRLADGYTRVDPIGIAEGEGIDVIVRPLDKLLGAFFREDSVGILLNSQRPTGMFHMTCAHELGHFFLNHGSTADEQLDYRSDASDLELEADQFAYSLMAPHALIVRVLKAHGWNWASMHDPAILYQLSLRLGLSYTAMVWSLARLDKLEAATAKSLANIPPADIKRSLVPQGTVLETNQDVWSVGPSDKDAILEPRPNDHIVMELPSHAAAGYLWSVTEAQTEGYTLKPILVDGRDQENPRGSRDVLVGGVPVIRYELDFPREETDALVSAPVILALEEVQPWNRNNRVTSDDGIERFALRTHLESIGKGLSARTRQRLVKRAQTQ